MTTKFERIIKSYEKFDPSTHNTDCARNIVEWLETAEKFKTEYPKFCQECLGWGHFEYEENQAPLGSGLRWMEQGAEPCEHCECKGLCPVCAEETVDDDGKRSCKCTDVGLDTAPECLCWMSDWED